MFELPCVCGVRCSLASRSGGGWESSLFVGVGCMCLDSLIHVGDKSTHLHWVLTAWLSHWGLRVYPCRGLRAVCDAQRAQVSSEAPLPPKRRDKPSKSETVFVTSHHMRSAAAATTTGARAMVMSSSPLPLDPGAGAGAAGGRRSSLVSRAVEPQSAPAGAASVPPPDYSSDEDDGDAAAPEEEARNPLRW